MEEERNAHLQASYDGLKHFVPVDIYSHNITAVKGLLHVLKILQNIEGFGDTEHAWVGHYSFSRCKNLLDVLYNYPSMAGVRHDLFLIFGFWHAYHYAHIALWDEFRSTFLAKCFFEVPRGKTILAIAQFHFLYMVATGIS